MKKISTTTYALMVLAIILAMCSCGVPDAPLIIHSVSTEGNGTCVYEYRGCGTGLKERFFFRDSCNKYNIGDTIK